MSGYSRLWRWLLAAVLTLSGGALAARITVNDDALDLLPGKAVSGDVRLLGQLGLVNRVIISLTLGQNGETASPEDLGQLKKSADAVASAMGASGLFANIFHRLPENSALQVFASLQDRLPLLLDQQDLATLQERLSAPAITEALQKDFAQLNSPAGIALKRHIQKDPLGISGFLTQKLLFLRASYAMNLNDGFFLSKDGRSCLILAESRLDLTQSEASLKIKAGLDAIFKAALAPGVEAQVIGSLPHTIANARSIQHDLKLLPPIATVLLLLLLVVSLRSPRALVVFAVPIAATPTAVGLTALYIGKISGIALGFGIVLLGIAVDYGIPLYLALAHDPQNRRHILRNLRKPLGLGYLTTAAVFFVLLFSEVPAQRQMGALSLTGITLAFLLSWLLVPTIVPQTRKNAFRPSSITNRIPLPSAPLQGIAMLLFLSLLAAGVMTWPRLHYNGDLRSLDVPDRSVLSAEQAFRNTWGQKGEQAFLVATGKTLDEALEKNTLIFKTLQDNRAAAFQSIAPILPSAAAQSRHLAAWQEFWQSNRPGFDARFQQIAAQLGFSPEAFTPFFHWLDQSPAVPAADQLIAGPLRPLADNLIRQTGEGHGGGTTLIMTTVTLDQDILPALLALEQRNQGISLLANQKWRSRVEELLRRDISVLSLAATVITIVITLLSFPHPRAIAAILSPVVSALSAMSVFSFLTNGQLNMMHLLMGVMVIGISVDYGIFAVCSRLTQTATISRAAVSVCAISTLLGFGVLGFAEHPALHTLGMTVLVGIGVAWPTALFVSPVVLGRALAPAIEVRR